MRDYEQANQKTLRKVIYDDLKSKILKGEIIPGTRLMELELSKKMGASRTPIREAIKMLAEDDLVAIEPNKGAYVSKISLRDLLEILEIRESMDGNTCYHAAERINDKHISRLKLAMEGYSRAAESENQNDMIKWDTEFHGVIVDATENKVMIKIANDIRELVLRFRYLYYGDFRQVSHIIAEHKELYKAISTKNPERARKAAKTHIRNLREDIIKGYQDIK